MKGSERFVSIGSWRADLSIPKMGATRPSQPQRHSQPRDGLKSNTLFTGKERTGVIVKVAHKVQEYV